jgi:hypothetical protein
MEEAVSQVQASYTTKDLVWHKYKQHILCTELCASNYRMPSVRGVVNEQYAEHIM